MNTNLTELVCILDRSGSMASICDDAIGGFNTFLKGQQETPGEARLTLVLFDNEYDVVYDCVPLAQVPPLTTQTFVPRGGTALLDAIARSLDRVGQRLAATPEPQRPGKVIVVILTDGEENSSKQTTQAQVADRIAHQRNSYGWEFLFLAANQDAIAAAARLQIAAADAVTFAATPQGVREVYAKMSQTVGERRRAP